MKEVSEELFKQLIQTSKQRAGILGLLVAVLDSDTEICLTEMKNAIANCIGRLIDQDAMVEDLLDALLVDALKRHLQEQEALEEVGKILNQN